MINDIKHIHDAVYTKMYISHITDACFKTFAIFCTCNIIPKISKCYQWTFAYKYNLASFGLSQHIINCCMSEVVSNALECFCMYCCVSDLVTSGY